MRFYQEGYFTNTLQQGDLLFPIPFPACMLTNIYYIDKRTDKSEQFVVPSDQVLESLSQTEKETGVICTSFESGWGMVITQSCDCFKDSRDLITVAKVIPATERFPKEFENSKKIKDNLLKRFRKPASRPQYLYLPEIERDGFSLPRSVVYLLESVVFTRNDYEALLLRKRFRLTHESLSALQERLAYCFGRNADEDDLYLSSEDVIAFKSL